MSSCSHASWNTHSGCSAVLQAQPEEKDVRVAFARSRAGRIRVSRARRLLGRRFGLGHFVGHVLGRHDVDVA